MEERARVRIEILIKVEGERRPHLKKVTTPHQDSESKSDALRRGKRQPCSGQKEER